MRAAMLLEPLPSTFACFFTPKVPLFCVKNSKRSGTFCYLLGRAVNNYTTSDPRTEISTFYLAPTARENVSSQVRPKRSFLIDFAKPSSLQTHISKATQDLIVLRLS